MFKQRLILEVDGKEERKYRFECESASPLGELYDALTKMRSEVMRLMMEYDEKEKKKLEADPKPKEEVEDAQEERAEPCMDGVEEQDC